jgi:hypothetical protein
MPRLENQLNQEQAPARHREFAGIRPGIVG